LYLVLQAILAFLKDPTILLGMLAILPLLETIVALMKWAQQKNVLFRDFVDGLHKYRGKLFELYHDDQTTFAKSDFFCLQEVAFLQSQVYYSCFLI
jgi:hypothetical protein